MSEGRLKLLICKNREQEAAAKIIFKMGFNRNQDYMNRINKYKGQVVTDDMKLDDTNRSKDQVVWGGVQAHYLSQCDDFQAYVFVGNMEQALSLNRKN